MSFVHDNVKYFAPFYKDEEFWVKPKYYIENKHATLLNILSDMFRRQLLNIRGVEITEAYWRSVIEQEKRVSALLIFSDKIYREYPMLQKPSKQDTPLDQDDDIASFKTISDADTVVPSGLVEFFLPKSFATPEAGPDELLKGARLKIRVSRQHVHVRSIVIPYQPSIILEDENILAVNKPFGVPSMGETNDLGCNEWNSILTWCRLSSDTENDKAGKCCDLINRLDLDVSGLVLLGKSGAYRKKRGFAGISGVGSAKTVKVYLAIVPRQEHGIRIMTPRLAFDTKTSRAVIKTQKSGDDSKEDLVCKTSIYPLLDIQDKRYSLVAVSLDESGQRHQIRFHLSLINATIVNDELYLDASRNDTEYQRTGVRPPNFSHAELQEKTKTEVDASVKSPFVHTEKISQSECQAFLKDYIFINGVSGFEESKSDKDCRNALIQRILYPSSDGTFADLLRANFEFCAYCGKCQKLSSQARTGGNDEGGDEQPIRLSHGIFLHSWRYFHPTNEHFLLEAPLPGEAVGLEKDDVEERRNIWWPIRTTKS